MNKTAIGIGVALLAFAGVLGAGYGISHTAKETNVMAADYTNYTTATISFGTQVGYLRSKYYNTSTLASKATLTNISTKDFVISGENTYYKNNRWALQIGSPANYWSTTSAGSLTITLQNKKYQSATIYADTYYYENTSTHIVTYAYNVSFGINGTPYINNGSWIEDTEAETVSQGACPTFAQYYCGMPRSDLTITVPPSSEDAYEMIYIEKIEFHIPNN
jgi:hypothetical protein